MEEKITEDYLTSVGFIENNDYSGLPLGLFIKTVDNIEIGVGMCGDDFVNENYTVMFKPIGGKLEDFTHEKVSTIKDLNESIKKHIKHHANRTK